MASKVILGGTNAYKKYYWALPDSGLFRFWYQSVIRSLNTSNGAILLTDKYKIDCSYLYQKADYIDFSTKLIKMNFNMTPPPMVAVMDGRCQSSPYDSYYAYGVARCYDISNGAKISLKNEDNQGEINLFPNPALDMITIETTIENFSCAIYDVNGNLLFYAENKNSGDAINIKSLKPGMYLITINDGEQSANYKFTKLND
jgi:hypothetical protein